MGLFSRREKAAKPVAESKPSLSTSQSISSLASSSSLKSPVGTTSTRPMNRTSAGTTSTNGLSTPLTPFSPGLNPSAKLDMPRGPDPQLDPVGYLRSLPAVRERSKIVTDKALKNELHHFDVDMGKFSDVVTFVSNIIKARKKTDFQPCLVPHAAMTNRRPAHREIMTPLLQASRPTAGTSISPSGAATVSRTSSPPFPRTWTTPRNASA